MPTVPASLKTPVSSATFGQRHQAAPGPAGLVIVNPPYGARIGDEKRLRSLYGSLGKVLTSRVSAAGASGL